MFYLKATIIKIKDKEIILEANNIGYWGYLIDCNVLERNQIIQIYFLNIKTDYNDQYLFFENKQNFLLAKLLLEIKNVGIKTIINIFQSHNALSLIDIAKNSDLTSLLKSTNITQHIGQQVIIKIRAKYLKQKYNKIQLNVIDALHKLGYKIGDIYLAILKTDANLDQETLLKNTILQLNEIYS